MVNQAKIFAILSLLFLQLPCFSNTVPNPPGAADEAALLCPYLTPTNFQAVDLGTTFIRMSWTQPGAPPPFYRMQVFLVSSGAMIYNTTFPNTSNSHTVNVLQPNTNYRFELCPLMANFTCCVPPAIAFGKTIIIDVIVVKHQVTEYAQGTCAINQASQPPNSFYSCTFNTSGNNITSFRIQKDNNPLESRLFDLRLNSTYGTFELYTDSDNPYGLSFNCENYVADPHCLDQAGTINSGTTKIAVFSIIASASGQGPAQLFCTLIHSDYEIVRLDPSSRPDNLEESAAQDRGAASNASAIESQILVSPNPFNEEINIYTSKQNIELATLVSIYDLQGRMVKSEIFPGNQETLSLFTVDISPGLYLIRVDTGENTETTKVMKMQ